MLLGNTKMKKLGWRPKLNSAQAVEKTVYQIPDVMNPFVYVE
jgi:hypothetical protein